MTNPKPEVEVKSAPKKGRPKKGAEQVAVIKREQEIIELRAKGHTWQSIADLTGYADPRAAYEAFQRGIKRVMQPAADEVRTLELERLDKFLLSLWPAIENGDPQAIDRGLKIMDRRARYLGLDAPVKQQVEVTTYEGGSEVDREVARLVALLEAQDSGGANPVDTPSSQTEPTST